MLTWSVEWFSPPKQHISVCPSSRSFLSLKWCNKSLGWLWNESCKRESILKLDWFVLRVIWSTERLWQWATGHQQKCTSATLYISLKYVESTGWLSEFYFMVDSASSRVRVYATRFFFELLTHSTSSITSQSEWMRAEKQHIVLTVWFKNLWLVWALPVAPQKWCPQSTSMHKFLHWASNFTFSAANESTQKIMCVSICCFVAFAAHGKFVNSDWVSGFRAETDECSPVLDKR